MNSLKCSFCRINEILDPIISNKSKSDEEKFELLLKNEELQKIDISILAELEKEMEESSLYENHWPSVFKNFIVFFLLPILTSFGANLLDKTLGNDISFVSISLAVLFIIYCFVIFGGLHQSFFSYKYFISKWGKEKRKIRFLQKYIHNRKIQEIENSNSINLK